MAQQSIEIESLSHLGPLPVASRVGPLVESSIINPFDPGTRDVPESFEAQAENLFIHIGQALKQSVDQCSSSRSMLGVLRRERRIASLLFTGGTGSQWTRGHGFFANGRGEPCWRLGLRKITSRFIHSYEWVSTHSKLAPCPPDRVCERRRIEDRL